MLKNWDWKVLETGGGPDYFLLMWFEGGSGESLRDVFARNIPQGYEPDPLAEHRYSDSKTAQKLREQIEAGKRQNIWCYDMLTVRDESIEAESGFGVGTCVKSLTEYVVELARQRPVTKWRVVGGGQGYDAITAAEGEGSASFLEYLSLRPLPDQLPDFEAVHTTLLQMLEQSPHKEIFRLGEFVARERMCKFTLLTQMDVTDAVKRSGSLRNFKGWQPHTEDANVIGRALIEECQFPGEMGKTLADRDDLIVCDDGESVPRPIGFELLFGFWIGTDYDAPSEF